METPELGADRICGRCRRVVSQTKRLAIMVDGVLQISVPLCAYPCYEQAMDAIMPMLDRKVPANVL